MKQPLLKSILNPVFGLNICMIVFTIFTFVNSATSQTIIYSTNFGTNVNVNPSGWTFSGVNMNISTNSSSSGYSGASGGAYLGEGNSVAFVNTSGTSEPSSQIGTSEAILLVNTMNYSTVVVSFGMRKSSAGYNSNATYSFEWSTDGVSYNTISYTEATAGSWGLVSGAGLTLPAGAANQPALYLRWSFIRTGTASNFKIDDVVITGNSAIINTPPTIVMDVVNTTNFLDGGLTTSPTSPYIVSGVISDPTDPASISGFYFTVTDAQSAATNLTVTAISSNVSIVPNSNIILTGNNASRNVKITPISVGYTSVTVSVTDGAYTSQYVLNYASSAAAATPSNTVWHTAMSDASDAIPIDDNYYVTGDDELDVLNVYSRSASGLPLVSFDYSLLLGLDLSKPEVDVEASASSPSMVNKKYWLGSMSTGGSSFTVRPNRDRLFATTISGTGATTTFSLNGYYANLRARLILWGDANGYNFTASAAAGVDSKSISGFAAEGMVFGPDNTTLYIGLRAPLVPTINRTKAVIAPILNFESWFNNGSPSGNPTFGAPIELDLGGRGFRDIIRLTNGTYIIVAGNPAGSPITSAIYKWTGSITDAPILVTTSVSGVLNLEGVMEVNVSGLLSMNQLQVLSDGGTDDLYNDGAAAKDLTDLNLRKFRVDNLKSINLCLTTTPIITASNNTICSGQTTTLTANGVNTYTWSGGTNNASYSVSPLTNTTYSVLGNDIYGCGGTTTITIIVNPTPTITAAATNSAICLGQTTTLTVAGANTYTWSSGESNTTYTIAPLAAMIYSVSGTNTIGCSGSSTVAVIVNPTPAISASASSSIICQNESSIITLSGASTYTWTDNSNNATYTVTPTVNTTYSVTGADANGCIGNSVITITVNPNPAISISASNSVICSGNSSSLTASGALTYTWTNGPNTSTYTVTPTTNTTYTVGGTDGNNCKNTSVTTISVNITPTVSVTASSNTICAGQTVTLTAYGASTYSWMPSGSSSINEIVTPNINTTYSLTGNDNGCYSNGNIQIVVNQLPTISISTTNSLICIGESVVLTASTNAISYSWSNGSSTASISVTPSITSIYSITVSNGLCSANASMTQSVSACTALREINDINLFNIYPNPFNESFKVTWDGFSIGNETQISVYNALGETLLTTKTTENTITINSKDWKNGTYFIKLNNKVYKIMKQE